MEESRTRLLAPIALAVVLVACVIVAASTGGTSSQRKTTATTPAAKQQPRPQRKTYVVRAGDTLTRISDRTGVPIQDIEALNPDLDPQTVVPGQRIRIRR